MLCYRVSHTLYPLVLSEGRTFPLAAPAESPASLEVALRDTGDRMSPNPIASILLADNRILHRYPSDWVTRFPSVRATWSGSVPLLFPLYTHTALRRSCRRRRLDQSCNTDCGTVASAEDEHQPPARRLQLINTDSRPCCFAKF